MDHYFNIDDFKTRAEKEDKLVELQTDLDRFNTFILDCYLAEDARIEAVGKRCAARRRIAILQQSIESDVTLADLAKEVSQLKGMLGTVIAELRKIPKGRYGPR